MNRIERMMKSARGGWGWGGGYNQHEGRVNGMTKDIEIKRMNIEHRMLKTDSKEH